MKTKQLEYKKEAQIIFYELQKGNVYLAKRLEEKMVEYGQYIESIKI